MGSSQDFWRIFSMRLLSASRGCKVMFMNNHSNSNPIEIEDIPLLVSCPCGGSMEFSDGFEHGHGPCTHCTEFATTEREDIPQ